MGKKRKPTRTFGSATTRERLLAWAESVFDAEGAHLAARLACVRGDDIEEHRADALLAGSGMEGLHAAAAILARSLDRTDDLVAMLAPGTLSGKAYEGSLTSAGIARGYGAIVVLRSRAGDFLARSFRIEPIGARSRRRETRDMARSELGRRRTCPTSPWTRRSRTTSRAQGSPRRSGSCSGPWCSVRPRRRLARSRCDRPWSRRRRP